MKYEKGYRLDRYTYLCLFDECLAVVKTNDKGEIIRCVTFGGREVKNCENG